MPGGPARYPGEDKKCWSDWFSGFGRRLRFFLFSGLTRIKVLCSTDGVRSFVQGQPTISTSTVNQSNQHQHQNQNHYQHQRRHHLPPIFFFLFYVTQEDSMLSMDSGWRRISAEEDGLERLCAMVNDNLRLQV